MKFAFAVVTVQLSRGNNFPTKCKLFDCKNTSACVTTLALNLPPIMLDMVNLNTSGLCWVSAKMFYSLINSYPELKGIPEQSSLGYLTLLEALRYCEVSVFIMILQ